MAYHADFWVAVAAAAPVIALAHAVAFERVLNSQRAAMHVPWLFDAGTWVREGSFRNSFAWNHRREDRQQRRRRLVVIWITGLPFLATAVGFTLSGVALMDALACLAAEQDKYTRGSISDCVWWSLWTVFAQVVLAIFVSKAVLVEDDLL